MKDKIVISSRSFNEDYSILKDKYDIDFSYTTKKYTESEMILRMDKSVVGIIAGTESITESVMKKAPNLKVISRYGVGIDNIDLKYAYEHNIKIYTTKSHVDGVAEHTLMLILAHLKNICFLEKKKNNLLKGKTVGIIGYGKIGQRVGELVSSFGANVIFCEDNIDSKYYNQSKSLYYLLENSDIITLHLPQTEDTINMIDYEQFDKMKDDVIFINTSRERIVNETSLYDFAKNKYNKIALDVCLHPELFEGMYNVIITQHQASYTYETRKQMAEEAINNLLEGLK